MAYKRNVDPADLLDEKYQNLSVLAKYLKAYIPCFCDCYGFINYNEKMIYSFIFPTGKARFADVKRAISELISNEFLIKVDSNLGQKLWSACYKRGQFLHGSDKKLLQHRNNHLYKLSESLMNGESFLASNIEHRTENIEHRREASHLENKKPEKEHTYLNLNDQILKTNGASPLAGKEVKNLVEIWAQTLGHFGIQKDARMDEMNIARIASAHGVEKTALALLGARYESGFKDFDPAKNVSIMRAMRPEVFEKWVNLGAKEKSHNLKKLELIPGEL